MLISGVSASMIQSNLATSNIAEYAVKRDRFYKLLELKCQLVPHLCTEIDEFPTYEYLCSFLPTTSPSRHAIVGCFLQSFWEIGTYTRSTCSPQV